METWVNLHCKKRLGEGKIPMALAMWAPVNGGVRVWGRTFSWNKKRLNQWQPVHQTYALSVPVPECRYQSNVNLGTLIELKILLQSVRVGFSADDDGVGSESKDKLPQFISSSSSLHHVGNACCDRGGRQYTVRYG